MLTTLGNMNQNKTMGDFPTLRENSAYPWRTEAKRKEWGWEQVGEIWTQPEKHREMSKTTPLSFS